MIDRNQIRELARELGKARWAGKSAAEKRAHALMMVQARLRKQKVKVVSGRGAGSTSGGKGA